MPRTPPFAIREQRTRAQIPTQCGTFGQALDALLKESPNDLARFARPYSLLPNEIGIVQHVLCHYACRFTLEQVRLVAEARLKQKGA